MGSSCFSRGNAANAGFIQKYAAEHGMENVEVTGCLCRNACKNGPNITVDGKIFRHVTPEMSEELLVKLREGE
jgi:NADH:ubiquinone oxidoreductase subunit E